MPQLPLSLRSRTRSRGRAGRHDQLRGLHNDVEAPIAANNNGVLFLNSSVRYEDITDGTSQTIFVGEKLNDGLDQGWASGTRASLRNAGSAVNASGNPSSTILDRRPEADGGNRPTATTAEAEPGDADVRRRL